MTKKIKVVSEESQSSSAGQGVMYYGRAAPSSRASRKLHALWRYGRAMRALRSATGKPRLA